MREGLVRLRHLVRVLALLHRAAAVLAGVEDLGGELVHHRLLAPAAAVGDEPADRERGAALGTHLDRHLVVGAADAPALDLEHGLHVVHRRLEDGHRVLAGTALDLLHRTVEDSLGGAALAPLHQGVDEARDERVLVDRVRRGFPLGDVLLSRHSNPSFNDAKRTRTRSLRRPPDAEGDRGATLLLAARLLGLGTVLRPAAGAAIHSGGVEGATHDVVPDAREVLHTPAADEHDGVFLEVVAFTRNVAGHFHPVGEPDAGDLAERRVRLLRGGRVDASAHPALLGGAFERRRSRLVHDPGPALADQLVQSRHSFPPWRWHRALTAQKMEVTGDQPEGSTG